MAPLLQARLDSYDRNLVLTASFQALTAARNI